MAMDIAEAMNALNLGGQIRQLRKKRGLTLREVSSISGLSEPLLSQIENSVSAPPIATLLKISRALGVHIGHFFQEPPSEDRIVVVRHSERIPATRRSATEVSYRYQALATPMVDKRMEPFLVDIEPREETDLVFYHHSGEEFLFVMEGRLEFRGNDRCIELEPGDSLYFDSDLSHAVRALDGRNARVMAVVYTDRAA